MALFEDDERVIVCPNCGNNKLEIAGDLIKSKPEEGPGIVGKGIGPRRYVCKVCGYIGPAMLTSTKEAEKIRSELKGFKKDRKKEKGLI